MNEKQEKAANALHEALADCAQAELVVLVMDGLPYVITRDHFNQGPDDWMKNSHMLHVDVTIDGGGW